VWGYDFVMDQPMDGRTLKCLTIVDEFTREGLTIICSRSLTAVDVIQARKALVRARGQPVCLRGDNAPELICAAVQHWLKEKHVDTHYIDPGSPWQNAMGSRIP
jgi:transposase InsO family protein